MIMGSGMEAVALGSEAFAMGSFFFSTFPCTAVVLCSLGAKVLSRCIFYAAWLH